MVAEWYARDLKHHWKIGLCIPPSAKLWFLGDVLQRAPDKVVQFIYAHEIAHAYQYTQGGNVAADNEDLANETAVGWGFDRSGVSDALIPWEEELALLRKEHQDAEWARFRALQAKLDQS